LSGNGMAVLWAGGGNNNILSQAHISYYRAEDFFVCCAETNQTTNKTKRDPSEMIFTQRLSELLLSKQRLCCCQSRENQSWN
jgi:hypothetical protein